VYIIDAVVPVDEAMEEEVVGRLEGRLVVVEMIALSSRFTVTCFFPPIFRLRCCADGDLQGENKTRRRETSFPSCIYSTTY
jgi:hypothetical protein